MNLEAAKRFLESHHNFVLAAHRSPDGDTLGSCLGLRLALLDMGKNAVVVCADPVPKNLRFLPASETVSASLSGIPDVVIYVDCADHARTDVLRDTLEQADFQFCIDHHATNPRCTRNGDWVEDVAATAELVYRLLVSMNVSIRKEIALCLFTGIATDTGNFSYSNTTPDTFRIAGELQKCGIDLPELNRKLFRTVSLPKSKLIAFTLESVLLTEDNTVGIICIPQDVIQRFHADESDCEGLIDFIRDIEPVEIACTLRESADGTIRGSLRSKKGADVSKVASRFGGGGHEHAAGFTLLPPMEKARDTVLAAMIQSVKEWKESSQS